MNEYIPLLILLGIGIILGAIFFFAFSIDQNGWRTKVYPLIMAIMGGLAGLYLHFSSIDDPMNLPVSYMVLQGVFLLLGIFHFWFLYKKLFWSRRNSFDLENDSFLPELVYTLLVLVLATAGLFAAYGYFAGFPKMTNYWVVGILFLLPFLFIKSYDALNQIPHKDFSQKWVFTKDHIGEKNWDWVNEMWVHFEVKENLISERHNNGRNARFRISAPRKVPLREFYRLAIREYNRQGPDIMVQDLGFERVNQGQFWWLFSIKYLWNRPNTWFRKNRYLDPYSSPVNNEIRPTDIIIARRMGTKEAIENQEVFDDGIPMGEL